MHPEVVTAAEKFVTAADETHTTVAPERTERDRP